ncbi:DUF1990 domain-containing protein [Streptomyces sp. NPDC002688]|uniref:DUF1990 family protein n=1 Tax=Streptomyces sp. NPDC002688 TaxID=3154423 RepID=UPI00331EBE72
MSSDRPVAHGPTGDGPTSETLTYAPCGATRPGDEVWSTVIPGFRRHERTVVVGHGDSDWHAASDALLRWGVKRRSGFSVRPLAGAGARVTEGARYTITAAWGPLAVHEPVRVVAVVDTPDTRGFAYGTLPGHPVSGEEAFIVRKAPDGRVTLTLRSLTAPAPAGMWRLLFPLLLIAQRVYRRRYERVLKATDAKLKGT